MYFSGQNMPPAGIVQKLCDLFGVEFNEGFAKFEEMHENWKATNGNVTYSTGEAEPRATRKRVKKVEKAEDAEVEKVEEGIDGKKNALMELLYKANVPYDVFRRAIDNLAIAEKIVYSKVDYDTFKAVEKILDGSYIKAEEVSDPWEI